MIEKKTYIYRLLFIIDKRISIDILLKAGLEYSQIALMLRDLFEQKLIIEDDENGIILTDEGKKKLEELNKTFSIGNVYKWILPFDDYRVDKFDKFDIYLPKRKK